VSFDRIVSWCAPWNDLFSHSKVVAGSVVGIHIMALFIGGGLAIAADRMILRVSSADGAAQQRQLREVRAVHSLVLAGVVLLFVSGALLAASDVETFLPSPIFWVKLALAALLVINGALLTRAERALRDDASRGTSNNGSARWSRIRLLSTTSVCLWVTTAVVGIVLSNAV
jgi:hypothetical protein